ncbi:hypothetical protein [Runella zeae]|uniref:hypothetical protein n=1 Tax=Runella zeae TaxID=94255 RepID=UPI00040AF9D0|nr:hypothetical protein [Runella zeae]
MIRSILISSLLLAALNNIFVFAQNQKNAPIEIADRREIFVDKQLITQLSGVEVLMHHPHNEGKVLAFDRPWEGNFSAYCTIIQDKDLFRLYYRGVRESGKDGNDSEVTCYAESKDGINWVKPALGIYELDGSKQNNVVLAHHVPASHNFSPFLDTNPNANPQERYKALAGTQKSGLMAFVSADGIHWKKKQETPVFTKGVFDSQNTVFWSESEKLYVCYFRIWSDGGFSKYQGFRSVGRTVSKDFVNWSEPVAMTFGDAPLDHLYTQQTAPYIRAPHMYLAIGARFMPKRQVLTPEEAAVLKVDPKYFNDCSDAVLMSSRGGNAYDRIFIESYIRPGIGLENWVSRSNYPVLNVVQTSPTELSVYVNESYAQPSAHIKRYSLRLDGFASIHAPAVGGYMITKPLVFKGKELEINYSTSAAGDVKVEILDANGNPIPGFKVSDSKVMIGNEIKRIVSWNQNTNVSSLAGKAIQLKFYLKDADLYSYKFNP